MEAYKQAFAPATTMILSPDSRLFRYSTDPAGAWLGRGHESQGEDLTGKNRDRRTGCGSPATPSNFSRKCGKG
jgi:hypothetical protein